jgi:cephalosporin hydroxylase/tetratricopeptide (TPR) repeat protein
MQEKRSAPAPQAAILFLIFNRPGQTARVFETIRQARPPRLYIAADGARDGVPGESELCRQAREVTEGVDWPCTVTRRYGKKNLGCKLGCSSAVSWFFEQEAEGIILEDDTLPDPSFFGFCAELLERYRDDEQVMHIAGNNFQYGRQRGDGSYYFSIYNHMWGWASWRRAWRHYDIDLKLLPAYLVENRIGEVLEDPEARRFWLYQFVLSHNGEIDSWDYQWAFAIWERGGLAILPGVNLTSNIGFGPQAVHCQNADSSLANLTRQPIGRLVHPTSRRPDRAADDFTFDHIFLGRTAEPLAAAAPDQSPQAHEPKGNPTMTEAARELTNQQQLQQCINDAVDHLQQGRPIKAMRGAEEALAFGIPVAGLNYLYAVSLNQVGRHEEALAAAQSELALNPEHSEAAALHRQLTQALIKPPRPQVPSELRGWHTSLPRETLLEIQNTSHNYSYRGVPMIKNPFDFAIYPLLIWDRKPRTIIEIGSKDGGSALWLADMLDNFGIDGRVYSLDIVGVKKVSHPRVTFLEGDGRELEASFSPEFMRTLPRPLLVIEDADHSYETSSHVLSFFDPYLEQGESIVIEDGTISDLVQDASYSSGPHLALKEFLAKRAGDYEIEGRYCDYFGYNLTWCSNGFLRRLAPNPGLQGDGFIVPNPQTRYPANHLIDKALIREFQADDPSPRGIVSQMSANERFQLYYAFRKELEIARLPLRFLEIGSFSGASLFLAHQALSRLGIQFQGICIEPGGTEQFHEIVKLLAEDVIHLPMPSHDAAGRLSVMFEPDRLPGIIFVDGDHRYQGVRQDILDYYPLLAPGGIMLFHDFLPPLDDANRAAIFDHHGSAEPGIRRACLELMEGRYGCRRIELPLLYPTDPTQTQPQLPIIPGVFSTLRAYRKPAC